MGGCDFTTVSFGKDAGDAYANAVREAEYERGHDPYNGTISTTGGFTMLQACPVRTTLQRQLSFIREAREYAYSMSSPDEAKAERAFNKAVPAKARSWALRAHRASDIKRDCACLEVTGKAATDMKARYGHKGRRVRPFYFIGVAAD